jgi:hypothetical protein
MYVRDRLPTMAGRFCKKYQTEKGGIKSSTADARADLQELDRAFASVGALNDFARDTLGLRTSAFDASALNGNELKTLKEIVMKFLARTRAENQGWTSNPEGTMSWLRDIFMTFFMRISATFHSETMFCKNSDAADRAKAALGGAYIGAQPVVIDETILQDLQVIDTPRDGSCMLWSVIVGLDSFGLDPEIQVQDNVGSNGDIDMQANIMQTRRILERDISIPEYRQAISLGLRREAIAEWNKVSDNIPWGSDIPRPSERDSGADNAWLRANELESRAQWGNGSNDMVWINRY